MVFVCMYVYMGTLGVEERGLERGLIQTLRGNRDGARSPLLLLPGDQ